MRAGWQAVWALLAVPVWPGEIVHLHTGAELRAERVERIGQRVVLHDGQGRTEIDAALVASIENLPAPAAPPAPAQDPPPAEETRKLTPRELVTEAALRHGLPPEFVHSVARTESAYQTGAVSPKGAIGVMQLMPATARYLNADPRDPVQNIDAGARHLRDLLLRFQNEKEPVRRALAAYNAGEGAVRKYKGVPPYRETQKYVEKVIGEYWKQVRAAPKTEAQ